MKRKQKDLEKSYAALVGRVWPLVICVYHRKIVDQVPSIEDFMQEFRLRLWKAYVKLDGDLEQLRCKESTFAYIIASNLAVSLMHKKQKQCDKNKQTPSSLENSREISTYEEDTERENREYLFQLIDNLSLKDKDVIIMDIEGYSNDEIARKMGISVNSVGARLTRIREKLKKLANNS